MIAVSSFVGREINRRPLLSFVLLTLVISWSAWGFLASFDLEPGVNLAGSFWLLGGLGPPISAVVITFIADGPQAVRKLLGRLVKWRIAPRWYAVGVLLPGVLVGATILFDTLVWDVITPIPTLELLPLFLGSILINMVIGGGLEEIGWRGFVLPRLQKSYTALTSSLVVGIIWIGWHAPLFVVPDAIQAELAPLPFLLQGVALAVLFTWLYNSTRGSLLLVVLFHGAVNAWLTSVWFLRDSINQTTLWTFAGLLSLTAGIVVLVYGKEHLSREIRQVHARTGSE